MHSELTTYFHPNEGQKDNGVKIEGTPVALKPSYAFIYAKDADHMVAEMALLMEIVCSKHEFSAFSTMWTGDFYPRPTVIYVEHCNHINFTNIIIRNVSFWTLHTAGCDDVLIDRIRILNDLNVANSDGIDPDHSTNVRIIGRHIEVVMIVFV